MGYVPASGLLVVFFYYNYKRKGGKRMKFSKHTPKLNRELIRDFSKRKLNISKKAMNLILRLTPYIDRDGRIHFNKESVRRDMFCDHRSFNVVINELTNTEYKGKTLLSYENGYYISNYHVSTNGEKSYLKHFPFFNETEFLGLTLNQTRLFLYIATLNVKNQFTKVAVENLYKNNLHDPKIGMSIYDDYKSMAEDLFKLIELGLVSVRLPNQKKSLDNSKSEFKELFHEVCGFKNNKKKRTSKRFKTKHVIGLKLNDNIYGQKAIENMASEAEIRLLSDCYFMYHEDMKQETINYISGKKNTMMELFGVAGLEIYRASLKKYFKEKHEFIMYYDLKDKAANHFTDFYLLEEVKKVILGALKTVVEGRGDFSTSEYSFVEAHIPTLIKFFVANSSDELKVIIDEDIKLIKNAYQVMYGETADNSWIDLEMAIKVTFDKHIAKVEQSFINECIKNGVKDPGELLSKVDTRELVVSLAKKSLLSQKKQADEEANKLKQIVRFFKKKQVPERAYVSPVKASKTQTSNGLPFDRSMLPNWLED